MLSLLPYVKNQNYLLTLSVSLAFFRLLFCFLYNAESSPNGTNHARSRNLEGYWHEVGTSMSHEINFQGRDFPVLSVVALTANIPQRRITLKWLKTKQTDKAVIAKVDLGNCEWVLKANGYFSGDV